jgi:hypothetical protein
MNRRTLGIIAMICAPAMLVEVLLNGNNQNPLITGVASMVFMAGWLCANMGMQQLHAAGRRYGGRTVLRIQWVGLLLAFLFGLFEATGWIGEENPLFLITDMAWPLSMLFMFVVGGYVIIAKRLPGWRRFVPMLCPVWLLLTIALGDNQQAALIGFGYAAVAWIALGYVVWAGRTEESAVVGEAGYAVG